MYVLLKMTTILKELRIAQLQSKNKWTLIEILLLLPKILYFDKMFCHKLAQFLSGFLSDTIMIFLPRMGALPITKYLLQKEDHHKVQRICRLEL